MEYYFHLYNQTKVAVLIVLLRMFPTSKSLTISVSYMQTQI